MNNIINNTSVLCDFQPTNPSSFQINNLSQAIINTPYNIKGIKTEDEELKDFLFTLGCYEGEMITVISILSDNFVISVKDARYSIDSDLAEAIAI